MPSLMLDCGHIMHVQCVLEKLNKRWPGPRISFFFAECPSCRKMISTSGHEEIKTELAKIKEIFEDVKAKANQRMVFEGIEEKSRITNPKDRYSNKPEEFALAKLSYYMCFKCNSPYFGGLKSCENDNEAHNNYKPSELICGKCAALGSESGITSCKVHGTAYIEYKCKFCCSIAQWFCWGSTHFCNKCHQRQAKGDYIARYPQSKLPKCPGHSKCALKLSHPPNGTEYAIGCAVCRNQIENIKPF